MNILHRYTLQTLKKNKSRTLVTIVGIILSMAMLTAVTVLISSCQAFLVRCAIEDKGYWHGVVYSDDTEFAATLAENTGNMGLHSTFALQRLGYFLRHDSKNFYKPYIYVAGVDSTYFENMPVKLTQGRLPENENEIILPDHLEANGGITCELGQKLSVDLTLRRNRDGRLLWQDTDYLSVEQTEYLYSTQYTVVGFYEKPSFERWSAPGFTALTVFSPSVQRPADVYFIAENASDSALLLYSCLELAGGDRGEVNLDLLRYTGVDLQTGYNSRLYQLAAALMLIIILASVCLIYNSFSISVNERIKQLGLLSSIGATAKQLKSAILYEGLVLCLVAVPVGIVSGIAGIALALKFAGAKRIAAGLQRVSITGALPTVPFDMVITPAAILVAVMLGVATVLVSAWLPGAKAMSLPTIDALRQTYDTDIRVKDISGKSFMDRFTGFEGRLAMRNFRRSRGRYRATIISLAVSITLFVSTFIVVDYMVTEMENSVRGVDYDLIYYYNNHNDLPLEERYRLLQKADGVTDSGYFVSFRDYVTVEDMYITNPENIRADSRTMMTILFVDDVNFNKWVSGNSLDPRLFFDETAPRGVSTNFYRSYDIGSGIYTDYQLLNRETVPARMSAYSAEFEIVSACSNLPFGVRETMYSMPVVFPFSMLKRVVGDAGYSRGMINCRMAFASRDPRQTHTHMENILGQARYNVYNARATYDQTSAAISLVSLFVYGFIALISLIATANVVNTISTNISLRRREFAILKSTGMSEKGFSRMLKTECMIYGLRAVAGGLPAAVVISYTVWSRFTRYSDIAFPFATVMYACMAASAGVMAVVYLTTLYATARLKKENLLYLLKNENI